MDSVERKLVEQLPQPKKKHNHVLVIAALGLSGSCLAVFFYGKYFLEQQLSPLVQTELSRLLNRPVSLGGVDRFSLNGVRFGKTEVPKTASEPNFLVTEAIDVQVDLWNYFQTQQIGLDVTVVKPHVFLRQDFANGQYLPNLIPPSTSTETGAIDLRSLKIEDADLTLQPLNSQRAITLTKLNLQSDWQLTNPSRQGLQFQGEGQVISTKLLNLNIPTSEELRKAIATQTPNGTLSITKADFNLTNGSGNLQLRSQDIGVTVIDGFFPDFPITPLQGRTNGTVGISLKAGDDQAIIDGKIRIQDVGIKVRDVPKPIQNISGNIAFDGTNATLEGISGRYGTLVGKVNGNVNVESGLNLNVALEPTDIGKALTSLDLKTALPIAGEIRLSAKITGKKPQIIASFSSTKPITVDRFVLNQVQGQIENKDDRSLIFKQVKANSDAIGNLIGSGMLSLGQSQVVGEQLKPNSYLGLQFNFASENINSEAIAALYDTKLPIPIGTVAAQVKINGDTNSPQILANFQAPQALYPTNGEVEITGNMAMLRNTIVQFPTGNLGLTGSISLDGKRPWQLDVTSNGTPLSIFPSDLLPEALRTGNLFGMFKLNSPEGSFEPKAINANGNLDLRLQQIQDPITATVAWNGKNLEIPRLLWVNKVSGNGNIALNQSLAITNIDFNLRSLAPQQVQNFKAFLPKSLQFNSGTLDFNTKITGALNNLKLLAKIRLEGFDVPELVALNREVKSDFLPKGKAGFVGEVGAVFNTKVNPQQFSPQIKGVVKLVNLGLGEKKYDPLIAGALSFNSKTGLTTDLKGKNDRLALRLDPTLQPIDFSVQLASTSVVGNRLKNQNLGVKVEDLSLALVAAIAGQPDLVDGNLSGELEVNFKNQIQAMGNVAIARPRFRQAQAEKLTANINFNNGNLVLSNGLLNIAPNQASKYMFDLAYAPSGATILQSNIKIESGSVAELFGFLKLEEFTDITNILNPPQYGKASTLASLPKIQNNQSFYEQLQYFAQIKARKEQQEILDSEANSNLPALSEFKGGLEGEIKLAILKQDGIKLGFDLTGKSWDYGKFAIDDVKVKGGFSRDVLTLETIKLQSGDRLGQITNTKISLRELNGKVELANFPVESLRPIPFFNNIPVDITGLANGFANLSGGLFNPKAVGKINLEDATVNRQPLESVGGDFDYGNGRFKFNSKIVTTQAQTEPIAISGDIPLQFCPIPEDNSFRVLCNLIGPVSKALKIDISVKNEGLAFVNILNTPARWLSGKGNGAISIGGTLDEPKVQGSLTLDQGAFQVAGLPSDVTEVQGKLDFNFDRFKADILGKFSQGSFSANGVMAIANPSLISSNDPDYNNPLTIVADKLNLDLKNLYAGFANGILAVRGSLLFPVVSGNIALTEGRVIVGEESPADGSNVEKDQFNIGFDNLLVSLGNNIQVTRFPLLNLLARGDLMVNGSLSDIRPSGRVNIERGQINTISTRLRLDRDFNNYADFIPSQGLNPSLNVRVLGTIPEVTRTRIADDPLSTFNPTNVPISNLGAQRTLQIQATVTGSVQSPNIDLRSSPPRSQSEILTLIGGGLLQQGGSDPTAVLANLAGGTIIGFLQDAIGDALNLSEFNLSPTTTSASGGGLSTIGIAAEAAIALTPSFSFAIRSVLNDPSQVTNYTFRYRANPNTLVLTNTDLNGNNSVSVEYESRF